MEGTELRDLIFKRIGIPPYELACPREKSRMTPCVARDGDNAMIMADREKRCVGCYVSVEELLEAEKKKHYK